MIILKILSKDTDIIDYKNPCGASSPGLDLTCFYTCIILAGSVAPSHSFHRETSSFQKATPSLGFECKN